MTARFLLDANALSEPLRPNPNATFLKRFHQHRASLAIPAPVWHEALFGLHRMAAGRRRDAVADFLHGAVLPAIDVLPYDAEAARWHAIERARLEKVGSSIPFADGMVAAVAVRFGMTLVTHNVRDFERVSGLSFVDWMGDAGRTTSA